MPSDESTDKTVSLVLMNREEQYSFWSKGNPVPKGWQVVLEGTREECCKYVEERWTDMRPLSLRKELTDVH